jgi:hypothetical protein
MFFAKFTGLHKRLGVTKWKHLITVTVKIHHRKRHFTYSSDNARQLHSLSGVLIFPSKCFLRDKTVLIGPDSFGI